MSSGIGYWIDTPRFEGFDARIGGRWPYAHRKTIVEWMYFPYIALSSVSSALDCCCVVHWNYSSTFLSSFKVERKTDTDTSRWARRRLHQQLKEKASLEKPQSQRPFLLRLLSQAFVGRVKQIVRQTRRQWSGIYIVRFISLLQRDTPVTRVSVN